MTLSKIGHKGMSIQPVDAIVPRYVIAVGRDCLGLESLKGRHEAVPVDICRLSSLHRDSGRHDNGR